MRIKLEVGFITLLVCFNSLLFSQSDYQVTEANALVVDWFPADLPADVSAAGFNGEVFVEFVVRTDGSVGATKVVSSTDPRLDEVALASVRRWTFQSAIYEGQPIESVMQVPVMFPLDRRARESFAPPVDPIPLPNTGIEVVTYGHPVEPEISERRLLGGHVTLEFTVTAEGKPQKPRVLGANCAELIRPAVDALMRTKFKPAEQSGIPVPATTQVPFEFSIMGESRLSRLTANGIHPADAENWDAYDEIPEPRSYADPVYPRSAFVADRSGEAEVHFSLNKNGSVSDIEIISASEPEFGLALAAAIPHWAFRAARRDGSSVESRLAWRHTFTRPTEAGDRPESRLAPLLAPDGPGVASAKGLDGRIVPLFRILVIAPEGMEDEKASATIEFIIDQDGRSRLPRIRESTSPEFGWAAATAVAQWLFQRPTRDGEPTDVRVVVPVSYSG